MRTICLREQMKTISSRQYNGVIVVKNCSPVPMTILLGSGACKERLKACLGPKTQLSTHVGTNLIPWLPLEVTKPIF